MYLKQDTDEILKGIGNIVWIFSYNGEHDYAHTLLLDNFIKQKEKNKNFWKLVQEYQFKHWESGEFSIGHTTAALEALIKRAL